MYVPMLSGRGARAYIFPRYFSLHNSNFVTDLDSGFQNSIWNFLWQGKIMVVGLIADIHTDCTCSPYVCMYCNRLFVVHNV